MWCERSVHQRIHSLFLLPQDALFLYITLLSSFIPCYRSAPLESSFPSTNLIMAIPIEIEGKKQSHDDRDQK